MTYVKYASICSYINVNHVISTLGRTGFRFNKDYHCKDKPLSQYFHTSEVGIELTQYYLNILVETSYTNSRTHLDDRAYIQNIRQWH